MQHDARRAPRRRRRVEPYRNPLAHCNEREAGRSDVLARPSIVRQVGDQALDPVADRSDLGDGTLHRRKTHERDALFDRTDGA
jgi:hypothetical protein